MFEKANAQQISLQAGQTFSNFQFQDSFGNELENLMAINRFYMMAEYRMDILPEQLSTNLYATVGLNLNGYGSTGSDPILGNSFEWDLSYLIGRFSGFVNLKVSPEFLVRGSQLLNNQVYDLRGQEDFSTPKTFLRGGAGAKFELTSSSQGGQI